MTSSIGSILSSGGNNKASPYPEHSMRILGLYAIVFLLDGQGILQQPDRPDIPVRAGDLILLYPDLPHRYGPGPGQAWHERWLTFTGPVFDLWRRERLLNPDHPVLHLQHTEYWQKQLEQITRTRPTSPEQSLEQVCRLQMVLASALAADRQAQLGQEQWTWLQEARGLLDEAPLAIDWDALAGALGMEYEGFRRKFARLAGTSPGKYHAAAVMRRACELIQQKHLGNKQISARCGFCDEFHFSRRFKQIVGMTPSEYRAHMP